MICPNCSGRLMITDNVHNEDDNETYRKKVCSSCKHVIFTVEYEVDNNESFRKNWNKYARYSKWNKEVKKKERENGQ